MSDLIVTDEGEYWETENRETLIKNREFFQGKINALAEGLETAKEDLEDASLEDIIAKIEQIAHKL